MHKKITVLEFVLLVLGFLMLGYICYAGFQILTFIGG